jgi:hypothetical protein
MRLVAPFALALSCSCSRAPVPEPPPAAPTPPVVLPPALVVLVVVDQLGEGHIERVQEHLTGGLSRMSGAAAYRATAVHPQAKTETCPGHVNLATGAAPAIHGIPSNRFYVGKEEVYCGDLALLRAESIGDVVSRGGGAVVSLSLKDRGALFLGGHTPALAAWPNRQGVLVHRPTAGAEPLPVAPALVPVSVWHPWLDVPWTPMDPAVLDSFGIPDVAPHEDPEGLGASFPKVAASTVFSKKMINGLKYTPAGGRYLTAAALASVDRFKLGQDPTADLLTVSYSHFDGIGHAYTPASQESIDALLRFDRDLAELQAGLDARVGAGRWTMLLTGDHGAPMVAPTYVDLLQVPERISQSLEKAGLPEFVVGDGHGFWLAPGLAGAELVQAQAIVRDAVQGIEGVEAVVFPPSLAADAPFKSAFSAGYVAERSADFELLLGANHIALYPPSGETGTDHGCPRGYDQRVPFLATGAGIAPGTGPDVDARQVAATLASLLGVEPPSNAEMGPVMAALAK